MQPIGKTPAARSVAAERMQGEGGKTRVLHQLAPAAGGRIFAFVE
jgi:hypothetical protein